MIGGFNASHVSFSKKQAGRGLVCYCLFQPHASLSKKRIDEGLVSYGQISNITAGIIYYSQSSTSYASISRKVRFSENYIAACSNVHAAARRLNPGGCLGYGEHEDVRPRK